jgi:hypothetical protein
MRKIAVAVLVLLGIVTFIIGQTPPPQQPYIWMRDANGHHFIPLSGAISVATDGKSATITGGKTYSFGSGFVTADPGTGTVQVLLDTAYVLYRTAPPTGPGACNTGTGALAAATDGYLYVCIPDGTGKGFRWARAPMEISW